MRLASSKRACTVDRVSNSRRGLFAVALCALLAALSACDGNNKKSDADRANDQALASASAMVEAIMAPPSTALVDAAGGDPLASDAREAFEKKWSCPTDRVDLKLRADIDATQYHLAAPKKPTDEVKNDPARLAKWTADQDAELAQRRASYADHRFFELKGCGHTELDDCRPHHAHGAVYPNWADCSEVTQPKP